MIAEPGSVIEGELGDGAFGPTILLELCSSEGVELLLATVRSLSMGTGRRELRLEEVPGVSLSASVMTLRMRVVEGRCDRRLAADGGGGFVWSCTADEWAEVGLLLEPLLTQIGHQYLTTEGVDDALIEVSRGERRPADHER